MSCLFCDQTPETLNAREKLAAIAKLLNCSLIGVILGVQSILTEHAYMKHAYDSLRQERDQWREEAYIAQRHARYREHDKRMLPAIYHDNRWSELINKYGADEKPFTAQYNEPAKSPKMPEPDATNGETS